MLVPVHALVPQMQGVGFPGEIGLPAVGAQWCPQSVDAHPCAQPRAAPGASHGPTPALDAGSASGTHTCTMHNYNGGRESTVEFA